MEYYISVTSLCITHEKALQAPLLNDHKRKTYHNFIEENHTCGKLRNTSGLNLVASSSDLWLEKT